MYIQGIYTEIQPVVIEWGKDFRHVPLNIRYEDKQIDGETKREYIYDCVEKVPVPVSINSIVNTAIKSKFTQDFIDYALANIFMSEDEKVIEYVNFVKTINQQAKEAGY